METQVALMDHLLGPALANSHREGVPGECRSQMFGRRPADALAAPGIEHDGYVEEPSRRRHTGDVGDPQLGRAADSEIVIDQIRHWATLVITACCR